MNAMQVEASRLRARGFAIVWLRPGEKRPSRRGWTKASQEVGNYRDGDGLGVMTGALSGNLVCVDLDSEAAVQRADGFLPPTGMIDGRPSKPRSHRFYRVTDVPAGELSVVGPGGGPRTRRFAGVLDLLGTGSQATAPPSIVKGEVRAWEDPDSEPATISYADLRTAVDRLAAACSPPKRPVGRPKRQDAPGSVPNAGHPEPRPDAPDAASVDPGGSTDIQQHIPSGSTACMKARAYLARLDPAVSGRGGRRSTYYAARLLVNDFTLTVEDAFPILAEEWNPHCVPPWSEDELRATLARAAAAPADPKYPRGCKLPPPGAWNDPNCLAGDFCRVATWRLWHDLYWRFTGTHYEQQGEDDLRDALTTHVQATVDDVYVRMCQQAAARGEKTPTKPRVGRSLVADTLAHLRPLIKLPSTTRLPSFIGDGRSPQLLAVRNGLLDLDTHALSPHTPDWFSRNCLPCDFDPNATAPRWIAVVARLLEDDDRIALLQEWFGYCLHRAHEYQKFLLLYGDGGTGKSTILAAMKAMIGEENYTGVSLLSIGESQFALAPTLGMLLNVSGDTSEIDRFAVGAFKSFVSGEAMEFEFKGRDAITARPTAKLAVSTNILPQLNDKSDGIWRRCLHLPMNCVVTGEGRVPGMDVEAYWSDELPGILNWSLAGLRRLRGNNGQFTKPAASVALAVEHRSDSDPARAFLLEHYAYDEAAGPMPIVDVYDRYREWCGRDGIRYLLAKATFNHVVERAFPDVDRRLVRVGTDKKVCRCWVGLRQAVAVPSSAL